MLNVKTGLAILLAVSLFVGCAAKKDSVRRPDRERWDQVTLQAEVIAIDYDQRLVTLMGTSGSLVTLEAGNEIKRFDEIEPGDLVTADYLTYLKAEFRDPTPEEEEEPLVIVADAGKAPEGFPPGAAVGAMVKAVVSVVNINAPFREVTVQGPNGNYVAIPDVDPNLIKDLKLGEVGILTYVEAIALTLEKMDW
jgi:hypothetical protein